ncbi:MAG: ATP-binding cassette domain-containing protein [Oscillospiraceae bacterium]
MLDVKNLSVYTAKGKMLLKDISFIARPGTCTAITGPSGSGKTTLLKTILGVMDETLTRTHGEIRLEGNSLLKKSPAERRKLCGIELGFIPQNPMTAFNMYTPVGAQMSETFRKRLKLGKNTARQLSTQMLESVNLLDTDRIYGAYPRQLSGGMLQRVAMAILLGLKPRYILADEPTSALDENNKQNFLLDQLKQLKKNSAVLFVSHDDDAIKKLCDEVLILQNGKIAEENTTDMIFSSPKIDWTKEFAAASTQQNKGVWIWDKLR